MSVGLLEVNHIIPNDYKIPIPDTAYFKDIHTLLLTFGFHRSGSSLLGYLLTAHRNVVMAHEPFGTEKMLYELQPPLALLNHILYTDKRHFERAVKMQFKEAEGSLAVQESKSRYNKAEKYTIVPNQWQACCESWHVAGIKNSLYITETLSAENALKKLKNNFKKVGIQRMKFIFTLRNPYDIISSDTVYWAENKRIRTVSKADTVKMMDYKVQVSFADICKASSKLLKLLKPRNIFLSRHEDLVADPTSQLRKLCEFLDVPTSPDYLDACASVVHKTPNKSRDQLDWSAEQKKKIEKLIAKYDFLNGYGWDT